MKNFGEESEENLSEVCQMNQTMMCISENRRMLNHAKFLSQFCWMNFLRQFS